MFNILLELLRSFADCKDNELEFCELYPKPAAKTQINSHTQLIFVDVEIPLQLSVANVIFGIDRITNLVSVYGHQTNSRSIPIALSKIYQRKVLSLSLSLLTKQVAANPYIFPLLTQIHVSRDVRARHAMAVPEREANDNLISIRHLGFINIVKKSTHGTMASHSRTFR